METPAEQITNVVDDFLIMLVTTHIDWDMKPSVNKWSAKEVLGHLIDSASNNLHRFVRCTYEQNFKLVYAQNEWVAAQHYQQAKIEDLLSMWRLLNKQLTHVLGNYPETAWQNTCDTGKGEVKLVTVEYLANDYLQHLKWHLKQVTDGKV